MQIKHGGSNAGNTGIGREFGDLSAQWFLAVHRYPAGSGQAGIAMAERSRAVEGLGGYTMISVIMLTYNRESFVSRAIESILAQTYRDFEFIIRPLAKIK